MTDSETETHSDSERGIYLVILKVKEMGLLMETKKHLGFAREKMKEKETEKWMGSAMLMDSGLG